MGYFLLRMVLVPCADFSRGSCRGGRRTVRFRTPHVTALPKPARSRTMAFSAPPSRFRTCCCGPYSIPQKELQMIPQLGERAGFQRLFFAYHHPYCHRTVAVRHLVFFRNAALDRWRCYEPGRGVLLVRQHRHDLFSKKASETQGDLVLWL